MLRAALCGNYVNFGVFRLYGDDALDNALGMFVKLLLSISQSDLLVSLEKVLTFTTRGDQVTHTSHYNAGISIVFQWFILLSAG